MSERIDLNELERRISADHNARLSRAQSLAMIARIRELEAALFEASGYARDPVKFAERFGEVIAKGTVRT